MKPYPVKPTVPLSALEALDIRVGTIESVDLGFAVGIAPALAVPERAVPDGTRAG